MVANTKPSSIRWTTWLYTNNLVSFNITAKAKRWDGPDENVSCQDYYQDQCSDTMNRPQGRWESMAPHV
jgi:hypothetical protein